MPRAKSRQPKEYRIELLELKAPELPLMSLGWRGAKRNVDGGFVRLVDFMGDDAAVVQAARVSYGEGTKTKREDSGLIRYLMKNRHTSPFEMVEFKFHAKMPIFVARQWVRHRTASINEVSGRYSEMADDFWYPDPAFITMQDKKNRQGRNDKVVPTAAEDVEEVKAHTAAGYALYQKLLSHGWARELARTHLGLNLYTEWYWKIDMHNLMGFLALRTDAHAQKEMQDYANAILELATPVAPVSFAAWKDNRTAWAEYQAYREANA